MSLSRRVLPATLLALISVGFAQNQDIYVPSTYVSYNISRVHEGNSNSNSSVLYVDEINDTTNKTFVGFQCDQGKPYFYLASKNPLVTTTMLKNKQYPTLIYQVDGGTPHRLPSLPWGEGEGFMPERLLVADENDALMFKLFRESRSKVVLKVQRPNLSDLVFTFPTTGFEKGYQAINACR